VNELAKKSASILVVGAGFIGVEWVTELQYFFPSLKLTIIDFLPQCLGPLPAKAAGYCTNYMKSVGINCVYSIKYAPDDKAFWKQISCEGGVDKTYVCIGVKASNYFMPKETLSDKGPGGGGWIYINKKLQVMKNQGKEMFGDGSFFAVGDCNFGCVGNPPNFELPPIPKISYPGEEQSLHALKSIKTLDAQKFGGHKICSCVPWSAPATLPDTWWPWGAGMFATSLGPHDACFVLAANENKGSGYMVNWWMPAAIQKELIETTKIDECKDNCIGNLIWHFVHHTPVHCWGRGKCLA